MPALLAGSLLACGAAPPPGGTRGLTASSLRVATIDDEPGAILDTSEGDDGGQEIASEGATPAMTELRLPWSAGETWYLTSGPHSSKRAALDFAPPNLDPATGKPYADACSRKRGDAYWVRAAADGHFTSVLHNGCPCVQIQHDDGTTTSYFHLRRSSVKSLAYKVGDAVRAGQVLGHPSCEIGPKACGATQPATGVHVHFQRKNATAERLPADGLVLSGWKVKAVGHEREGIMTKGEDVRQTRGKLVGWACSPTSEVCGGIRNDLESDNPPPESTMPMLSLDGARQR